MDAVAQVRRFNRFYTRAIGVLHEHLLQSEFSLTEVRVLYELAHRDHLSAVELCDELGLDPGYLSRMLRGFSRRGLVTRAPAPGDRRRALLSLTPAGRNVFEPLDRRSSAEVAALLGALSGPEQQSLVEAMGTVESLLTRQSAGGDVSLRRHRPGDIGWVVERHGALYWQEWRYDERFEAVVAGIVARFVERLDPERERCWIAERGGQRLGSVFLVRQTKTTAKLRLLLVEPQARGLGLGKRLVQECVDFARKAGYRRIVLWTQSELTAARTIYQRAGFRRIADERHDSWGRKGLVSETWELRLPGIPEGT